MLIDSCHLSGNDGDVGACFRAGSEAADRRAGAVRRLFRAVLCSRIHDDGVEGADEAYGAKDGLNVSRIKVPTVFDETDS